MSFTLTCRGWSHDADLQIVHADVYMEAEGEVLIDEPLCVDVGLPALLLSVRENVSPNRWAAADAWHRMPFFVCGCGDPECRAFSFIAQHQESGDRMELIEVEEKQDQPPRGLGKYEVSQANYARQVKAIGETFLEFVEGLDYRPYYKDTVSTVKRLLAELD
ncbi:hypothetical protein [Paenibacillus cremeus]|uniref:Uncharacterized protein n=1 Tax=Paenibacillus cremeus TaxID=2163881 RepID=A0A559KBG1_9BACL|nr:hypothetical protein [Paenibacillus cremeus]TVY09433.1 hypothetical protein FPZ49_13400 [Paenibacillus cremeus]